VSRIWESTRILCNCVCSRPPLTVLWYVGNFRDERVSCNCVLSICGNLLIMKEMVKHGSRVRHSAMYCLYRRTQAILTARSSSLVPRRKSE